MFYHWLRRFLTSLCRQSTQCVNGVGNYGRCRKCADGTLLLDEVM